MIPPDTSNLYMVLGYAVVVLILFGMIGYFVNRARRLRADLKLLEELEREEAAKQKPGNPSNAAQPEREKELIR